MKPKPFSALNHFTVPCATCAPTFRACGRPTAADGARSRSSARRTRTWNSNRARRYNRKALVTALRRRTVTRIRGRLRHPAGRMTRPYASADEPRGPHRPQRRLHPMCGADDRRERVEGLQTFPGVEDDGLLRRVQPAVTDQLAQHRDRHATGGLGEDAGGPGEVADALHDLVVADPADRAAGPPDRVEGVGAVGRVADVERLRDAERLHRL